MSLFRKVLVANRSEIAVRIIRACRELGIRTVAVYSKVDQNALHVQFADEAVCIGPAPAAQSYLHQPAVLAAAQITGADAVHPGYGFLSENASFAAAVRALGKVFIGPAPEHLRRFGDKLSAKEAARDAGLPLLPGSLGAVRSVDEALAVAAAIGFPVILKAAAGGGGKGMRVVETEDDLRRLFTLTQSEARRAFGQGDVFVERFLRAPRHVEVQVAGDGTRAVHLGTRDCSMQRRHQKLIEEAPAPGVSPPLYERLTSAAVDLVEFVGYRTVGTCEFLVDGDAFYFLEVNPRIQVEHPVTEQVTGRDLIQEQIGLAAGEQLSFQQAQLTVSGHAIEVRLNAEDPATFTPSPGRITGYHQPGGLGVRVDSAVHEQAMVQPYYDSLLAKLIVTGRDREHAIQRMLWAMDEFVVEGVKTTLPLQKALIASSMFRDLNFHTRTVDDWIAERRGVR